MKCISSPLLQDKSNNKAFPFFRKPNQANPKPGYSLNNLSKDSKSSHKNLSHNTKRMWIPEEKENFEESSELRKKVKLDRNHLRGSENNHPASSTEFDSVWRIDQAFLENYSNASTTSLPSPDPNNPDDQIQIACSKILQELSKNNMFYKCKLTDDSAVHASDELYNNLKSQFWVKYNKNTVPKFVLSGIAIEGGTGLDESSFVKLITQPPSTSTGQKDFHATPVGKSHQIDLTSFTLNNKSRTRRPVKLVWSPNALSKEDWEEYLAEVSKIVGEKISKEDAVAQHLVKFHGDFDKAIEEIKKKKMYYRNAFRVCQKNLRSRSVVS